MARGCTKKKLADVVVSKRQKRIDVTSSRPRFVEMDDYQFEGRVYKRLRIILRSNGCSVPVCTMCPFPNEGIDQNVHKVTASDYLRQIKSALSEHTGYEIVSIYNDGSFFAPEELPSKVRNAIYSLIAEQNCCYLMVESLPNFISRSAIADATKALNNTALIVGIGLQSSSKTVRDVCIQSPFTSEQFLNAINTLQEFHVRIKAYVLLKPPFLTEAEALYDATRTAIWLLRNSIEDVTVCPVRAAPGTVVYDLYSLDLFKPPKLTTLVRCLHDIKALARPVRISLSNIGSPDLHSITPHGCEDCESRILDILKDYNRNPYLVDLGNEYCKECNTRILLQDPIEFRTRSLLERVEFYLGNCSPSE